MGRELPRVRHATHLKHREGITERDTFYVCTRGTRLDFDVRALPNQVRAGVL